jgi:macrolide transport system ATP-binding/permease protein
MALIELHGITRSYQVGKEELCVLKGITLEIAGGEFVAIMGPSGSGKSTLMQIMGLLDRPTSGRYRLLGRDVSKLSDDEGAAMRCRTIGFIFQMFNLLPRTTALANVELPMIYSGVPERGHRAQELLKDVGLADRMTHRPNELSGGQQQRVAIARALVNRPRIVFADEPTGNLASAQAEEILGRLKALNESGITVIMVTHEPDIAAHAKRIIRLKDGQVVVDERRAGASGLGRKEAASHVAHPALPGIGISQFIEYTLSALRATAANKVRAALSMLGILIGVAAVITMLALGNGAQKAVEANLAGLGSNLLTVRPVGPMSGGVRAAAGTVSRLTFDDVKAISAVPHVLHVEGNVQGTAQVVYGSKNTNTSIYGVTTLYPLMHNAKPSYGRFFTDAEDQDKARVALLGQTVINNIFGDEDPVDKTVKINHVSYAVIGVLPLKGSSGPMDQDDKVIIPLNTAMKRALGQTYLGSIAVECDGPDSTTAVMESVQKLMRERHRVPDYKDDDVDIMNMSEIRAALSGTTKTFTMLLGIVAAISLLVGGIGIMNIMLVSVGERTREIGLRKAVGAPRRAILAQFLIEAALLSTMGGAIGILLGVTVSLGLSKLAGWAAIITPQAVALSSIFSASVGVVFGFWPARKASLLSPIEALRYE